MLVTKLRSTLPAAVSAALPLLLGGCPLLDVEAEVPEVCLTYAGIEIDGAAAAGSVEQTFVFDDLSGVHDLLEYERGLAFTRAELRVVEGVDSLDFVEELRASVASGDPDSTLPELVLFSCTGDCAPEGATLSVPAAAAQDALAYVAGDSLVLGLAFRGAVPATHFVLDVDVCLSGSLGYTVEP